LVWRLFHEEKEVRVEAQTPLSRGCRCTVEYYHTILSRFPEAERIDMRGDDGLIAVECAFCSKTLAVSA
ncbi:MAG: Hsp33 family molecular chaperone HslO, partial [Hyphomicrobiales bacterium]